MLATGDGAPSLAALASFPGLIDFLPFDPEETYGSTCVCAGIRLFEPFDSATSEHNPEGRIAPHGSESSLHSYGERNEEDQWCSPR